MNNVERQMLDILKRLKEEFGIIGIKSEFEAEGSRTEDIIRLNEIIFRANLDSYIKIGGCEAISDLYDCKMLGASGIIAPMIETPFAMSKFISAIKNVFDDEEIKRLNIIVNAETITCFENIDDILVVKGSDIINSIVIGRTDLSKSMKFGNEYVESNEIFEKTRIILKSAKMHGYETGIGGGISLDSIAFIKELAYLTDKFETRKVVFNLNEFITNIEKALISAIEFEMLYLKNKYNYYSKISEQDINRLKQLEARIGLTS